MRLTLASGRIVSLSALHQRDAYAGVLAGRPGVRMNRRLINSLREEAQGYGADGAEPYLFEPDAEHLVTRLPAVSCIAVFDSGPLEHDDSEPYSSLVVAWFQYEFGSIPSKILELVAAVDWESRARPWCW